MASMLYSLVKPYLSPSPTKPPRDDLSDEGVDDPRETFEEVVERVRRTEYPQLRDACYLDYAASPPFPTSLIQSLATDLTTTLYSNPHSHSPSALTTSDAVTSSRGLVLSRLFGVRPEDGWDVVFTSGTTAALKMAGESVDWKGRKFVHPVEAHTSLIGVRDLVARGGGAVVALEDVEDMVDLLSRGQGDVFGVPAQCNATGKRNITLIRRLCDVRSSSASREPPTPPPLILVDAAAYVSSSQTFPLSNFDYESAPDLIAFSMYKVLGHPTGLGCLVVKRTAWSRLQAKTYHGGGTLDAYTPARRWKQPRRNDPVAAFEDGTINVHAVVGLSRAFEVYDRLFGEDVGRRGEWVRMLTRRLYRGCAELRHGDGQPVVKIYTESVDGLAWVSGIAETSSFDQGPTLCFNVLTPSGTIVPPNEVDRMACIQNIHLRAGRHCNPGVVVRQVGASEDDIVAQWTEGLGCDEASSGSVISATARVSVGVATTMEDVERFLNFLRRFFVHREVEAIAKTLTSTYTLSQVIVYPIKSCAGQVIATDWPLTSHGLQHDREWAIVRVDTGKTVSQKRYPRMAMIRPRVDRDRRVLTAQVGQDEIVVPLDEEIPRADTVQDKVCGQQVEPQIYKDKQVQRVLSQWLGIPCTLARQPLASRHTKLGGGDRTPLLLSNESPFLLINKDSVDCVSEWLKDPELGGSGDLPRQSAAVFRANFVISSSGGNNSPFIEDNARSFSIGPHRFISLGPCRRCLMVCVDQCTGEVRKETYLALAKHRRNARGRIEFGQHLVWRQDDDCEPEATVAPGMAVTLHDA